MPPDVPENSVMNGVIGRFSDKKQVAVRTEFVVKNILGYLLDSEFALPRIPAQNSKEKEVIEAFKTVVDMFKLTYSTPMAELSASLDVTPNTISGVILGVSNELFCEGIHWSKISTFFVFISELTIQCLRKGFPEFIVQEAVDTSLKFVHGSLEKWIIDHKGWEGMIDFSKGHTAVANSQQQNNSVKTGSLLKNAFYGTVRVLGTLANLAMYSSDPLHTC